MRIYEINTRVHCRSFDEITQAELTVLSELGFDAVWLMGVWQISQGAVKISKIISNDYEGSPYAIADYEFSSELGGKSGFEGLINRIHSAGMKVIVDFVSNHMALDSPWIDSAPDLFIRSNPLARNQLTAEFALHRSGELIAFGRDPYFPPWHDTAQLDYTNPRLRSRMVEVLKRISRVADGVRCDMAMLVLRDYFRNQWYPRAPNTWFDERMPGEFWDRATEEVKRERPDFTFIAEAYWEKEEHLLSLGFDLAYEKKLYDGLVERNPQGVIGRLARGLDRLKGSLFFIENHDEQRAASVFSTKENLASAALMLALPGSVLIHEGQMEGKRERLPVQRITPLSREPVDTYLKESYVRLLTATRDELFRRGDLQLFDSGVAGTVSFVRRWAGRTVAYIGRINASHERFHSLPLGIAPAAQLAGATQRLQVTNLLNRYSISIQALDGSFHLYAGQLGIEDDAEFCLIEVSSEI